MNTSFFYHADIFRYVVPGQVPLYVEPTERGRHPEHLWHDHKFLEIVLVTDGHARHRLGKYVFPIRRGDLLVIQPGSEHCYEDTGDLALVNVVCDYRRLTMPRLDGYAMPLFQRLFPQNKTFSERELCLPAAYLEPPALEEVLTLVWRLKSELDSETPGRYFACLAIFMEFAVALSRSVKWEPARRVSCFPLEEVVRYMNRNLAEPLTVDDLARCAKMSRRNFFRYFKEVAGCSPMRFLEDLRVGQATELLITTDRPMETVASACGFCDANYMSRVFRKRRHRSPRRLREDV